MNFNFTIANGQAGVPVAPTVYKNTRTTCKQNKSYYCVYCDKWCFNKKRHVQTIDHVRCKKNRTVQLLINNINERIVVEEDEVIIYRYRQFILILRERLECRHWCNKCNYYTDRHDNWLRHNETTKHLLNNDELIGVTEPDSKMNGQECHFVYLNQ